MATFSTFDLQKDAETRVGQDGTTKRNIIRKGKPAGLMSKTAKNRMMDDGSSVLLEPRPKIDPKDPLYDPVDDANYVLVSSDMSSGGAAASSGPRSPPRHSYDPEHRRMVFGPMLTLPEFKRCVAEALEEFFSSEDFDELQRTVQELRCPEYHYEVVKRAVSMAMDRKDRERELVSRFLSSANPSLLSTDDLGKGFERLFELMDELSIDTPGAAEITAAFLARAVIDEILPPAFLIDPVVVGLGGDVVVKTKRILCRDHQYSRVERIWGPGDGRPVPELKVAIDQLLVEYLLSRQLHEAEQCVRELGTPHFHHELVKRAVTHVVDKDLDQQEAMLGLLNYLRQEEVLSPTQALRGFARLHESLADLALDCPNAAAVVEWFEARVTPAPKADEPDGAAAPQTAPEETPADAATDAAS